MRRPHLALGLPRPDRTGPPKPPRAVTPELVLQPPLVKRMAPRFWVASTVTHLAVAALVILLELHHEATPSRPPTAQPERAVSMVYLPRTKPQRRKTPVVHPPAASAIAKESTHPGLARTELPKVPERDAPAPMTPEARPVPAGDAAVPQAEATPDENTKGDKPTEVAHEENDLAMVAEARRLFGPHVAMGDAGSEGTIGPVRQAGFPVYMRSGGERCAMGNAASAGGDQPTSDGFVEGTVRNENNGDILPGAFIQILGTPYVTFSDDHGHYRLVFDSHLVNPCRTQIVRVTAQGYRARTLVLALGRADNTIDLQSGRSLPFSRSQ